MLDRIVSTLSGIAPCYFNIRSVENVPNANDEFSSVYVESASVEYPQKAETVYVVVYAKRANDPTSHTEFTNFKNSVFTIVSQLQKDFTPSKVEVRFGNNDMFFFAEIRLSIKEVIHV